jgi:hypothetical protein
MLFNNWVAVLELSCMWQMTTIREMTVKKILGYQGWCRLPGEFIEVVQQAGNYQNP